jgi:hypothetical protein
LTSGEFILFSFEHWLSILLWSITIGSILFLVYRKLVPAGLYDPFHLFVAINLGTAYAVVFSLYQYGQISNRLFIMILSYAIVLFVSLYIFFRLRISIKELNTFFRRIMTPQSSGKIEIGVIVVVYFIVSVYLVSRSGLGAFTDTNRFEDAKGVGAFVRILDLFRLIIIAYFTIIIFTRHILGKRNKILLYFRLTLLIVFILFSALQNGAKFALFESFFTMIVALKASRIPIKFNLIKVGFIFVLSTFFALIILSLSLSKDTEGDKGLYTETSNPVIDRFIFRILSNGDMYYLSLPNDVIDNIEKDNVLVRIGAQIIGNTQLSNILGYDVSKYSVGKSILLYHNPNFEFAGGPVSHLDLFSYIYLGHFGYLFVILVAYLIFCVADAITSHNNSFFFSALVSATWLRCLAVLIEPPVGIAYVLDIVIIIFFINLFGYIFRGFIKLA